MISYSHHNMGTWKRKKFNKLRKASNTPGRQKVATCQASKIERYMAKRNRSWKHKRYGEWCRMYDGKSPVKRVMGGM